MLRVTKDATFLALSLGCLGFSKRKDLVFIIQLNVEKKVQSHFLALGWAIPFIVGRFFFFFFLLVLLSVAFVPLAELLVD